MSSSSRPRCLSRAPTAFTRSWIRNGRHRTTPAGIFFFGRRGGHQGNYHLRLEARDAYFYLPFERSGDSLVFDQKNLKEIVASPSGVPYMFYSKAVAHGDEIMFTYFDVNKKLQLLRWKDTPGSTALPHAGKHDHQQGSLQLWADSNRGLYAPGRRSKKWRRHCLLQHFRLSEAQHQAPVAITYTKAMERSMFHGFWLYDVKWANDPENVTLAITVVKLDIYRRARGSGGTWLSVGSVAGRATLFGDVNGITAISDFEYTVTAVNEKGVESLIESIGTRLPRAKKAAKARRSSITLLVRSSKNIDDPLVFRSP